MLQALHPRWRGEISVPYKQSNKVSLSAYNQPHLRLLDIVDACRGGNTAWKVEILTVLLTFFHHYNSRTTSSLSHLLPKPHLVFQDLTLLWGVKCMTVWNSFGRSCNGSVKAMWVNGKLHIVSCERIISNVKTQMFVYFSIC